MQRSDLIVIGICETKHSSLPQVLRGNTEKEEERGEHTTVYLSMQYTPKQNYNSYHSSVTGPVTYTLPPPTA